jgi:hypothetical protein
VKRSVVQLCLVALHAYIVGSERRSHTSVATGVWERVGIIRRLDQRLAASRWQRCGEADPDVVSTARLATGHHECVYPGGNERRRVGARRRVLIFRAPASTTSRSSRR